MFKFKFKRKKVTKDQEEYVEREVKKMPRTVSAIFLVYVIIFVSIIIWFIVFKNTYYISDVQGPSMSPTLNSGVADNDSSTKQDFVYVNMKKEPAREDIVTINTGNKLIIKRVIATGGDKITIRIADDGYYHVCIQYAGSEEVIVLEEDYIKSYSGWTSAKSAYPKDGQLYEYDFYNKFLNTTDVSVIDGVYYYEVPENNYFCLGDNRAVSLDSRDKGTFKRVQIKGVAEIIVKNGCKSSGISTFFKKIGSIISFYWKNTEKVLAR